MIALLWAQDKKGLIGKDNQLPWRLPADLKYFMQTTLGHPVIMGRKTYESIGKPLPGRTNIILTNNQNYQADGCIIFHSKEAILEWVKKENEDVFVVGGSEIYQLFLSNADHLYVTKIDETFAGDAYFPTVNWDEWTLAKATKGSKDEKNPYDYEFQVYKRNN